MQVWDYVSDQYVHRLIQSSLDGKLVEVPSPDLAGSSPADRAQAAGASAPAEGERPAPGSKGWRKGAGAASSAGAQASETALAMNEDMHMLEVSPALYAPLEACVLRYMCRRDQTYSNPLGSDVGAVTCTRLCGSQMLHVTDAS